MATPSRARSEHGFSCPRTGSSSSPEEGGFDFTLVDRAIDGARRHGLRLVLLWFASFTFGIDGDEERAFAGIESADVGRVEGQSFVPGRRLNGDETHQ